jgi:hypothetical protein
VPNPVIIADLEARFRPLVGSEVDAAQALLDDAWATLLAVLPDLEARMAAGTTSDSLVVSVVSAMVLRVLRNPNGVRSWSVDDYSETRDSALSAGALYVSPEEVQLLAGKASVVRRGAFSVAVSQEPVRAPGSESEYIDWLRYGRRW